MQDNERDRQLDSRIAAFMKGGKMIVEVGCGAGYTLDLVSSLYEVAIGIDVSERRLNQRDTPPNQWQFIKSDLNHSIPLPGDCANLVLANQVVEHIADPVFFARQMFEVLRPGGMVLVTTPNVRYVRHLWKLVVRGEGPQTANKQDLDGAWDDGHIHYFTHKDLRNIFLESGFSEVMSEALIDLNKGTLIRKVLNQFSRLYVVREFLSGNMLLVAIK